MDIRPWLSHETHAYEPDYPSVVPHPSANPVTKVLDGLALRGVSHAELDYIDIRGEYQVRRLS